MEFNGNFAQKVPCRITQQFDPNVLKSLICILLNIILQCWDLGQPGYYYDNLTSN